MLKQITYPEYVNLSNEALLKILTDAYPEYKVYRTKHCFVIDCIRIKKGAFKGAMIKLHPKKRLINIQPYTNLLVSPFLLNALNPTFLAEIEQNILRGFMKYD